MAFCFKNICAVESRLEVIIQKEDQLGNLF